MKIRNGFVSNSSSSSFVINKDILSEKQIEKIHNHIFHAKNMMLGAKHDDRFGWAVEDDAWSIVENDTTIEGWTIMNNFDMYSFLEEIGVDATKIEYIND